MKVVKVQIILVMNLRIVKVKVKAKVSKKLHLMKNPHLPNRLDLIKIRTQEKMLKNKDLKKVLMIQQKKIKKKKIQKLLEK